MTAQPWIKFYPRDWRGDQALRAVSLAARGLWMEMLCLMHEATPYGHLVMGAKAIPTPVLARIAGASEAETESLLSELEAAGVLSRKKNGVITSRRMIRDRKRAEDGRKSVGKRWSQDTDNQGKSARPNRSPDRSPTTQKPEARSQIPDKSLATLDSAGANDLDERAELTRAAADLRRGKPPAGNPRCAEVAAHVAKLCGFVAPPGDAHLVRQWLEDGFDPETVIYPEVEAFVGEMAKRNDRPRKFKLIDLRLRERLGAAAAADDAEIAQLKAVQERYPGPNPAWEARQREAAAGGKR